MFEKELKSLEDRMTVPYPERLCIIEEIKSDMEAAFEDIVRLQKLSEETAYKIVIKRFLPNEATTICLESLHAPLLKKILCYLPPSLQSLLLDVILAIVPAFYIFYLFTEVPMINFLMQGGLAIYVILVLAGIGLYLQLARIFNWFILKHHVKLTLDANTATPLYFAAASICFGLLGTSVAYYKVLLIYAKDVITFDQLKHGLYEPLPCVIIGSAFAIIIILLQIVIQTRLRAMLKVE